MTMPVKIYAGHHGYGTYWQTNLTDCGTPYIRADLAEELARALRDGNDYLTKQQEDAIARYNAAINP